MRFLLAILLSGSILLLSNQKAMAEDVTVNLTVDTMVDLALDTPTYNFDTPSGDDLDAGFIEGLSAMTLTVKSNVNWEVQVRTTDSDMGTVGGYAKPISDFLWRESGGAYQAITQVDAQVSTGTPTSSTDIIVDYKVLLGWADDKPGAYDITLRYTLSSTP